MNKRQYFLLLTLMLVAIVVAQEGCHELTAVDQPVYLNWPIYLECSAIALYCDFYEDYQCNFTTNGSSLVLHSATYDYDDYGNHPVYHILNVTIDTPPEIEIKIQTFESGSCCSKLFRLQKQNLPNETCVEATGLKKYFGTKTRTFPNEIRRLHCLIPGTSNSPPLKDISEYNITWYHDCNTTLPEGTSVGSWGRLEIGSFDQFKHPGSYLCSIEHNQETRYITRYVLCAETPTPKRRISVHCNTEKIRYKVGETAKINCTVNVGSSSTDPKNYHMNFYPLMRNGTRNFQNDPISCTAELGNNNSSTSHDSRVKCSFSRVRLFDKTCFPRAPTEEEWNKEANKSLEILTMSYEMRNLQAGDFIMFEAFVRSGSKSNNSTYVVEIIEDEEEEKQAAIIGASLGVSFLLLIVVVCVAYRFRLHFRLMWRRSSCVKFDDDSLKYGAYFAYFWSNVAGERVKNPRYEDLIDGMRKYIEILGFQIYDPAEAPSQFQWQTENIMTVQRTCDRVVIILTSELLKEANVELNLYSNFLDGKFILIKTPEFDETFKSLNEERRNGLKAHFQRNFTINWSGKGQKLSKNFQMELELAMPKRRRVEEATPNKLKGYENLAYENGEGAGESECLKQTTN